MFRQTLVFFSIFLLSVGVVAYLDHVRLRHHDRRAYQLFVRESGAQKARHALESHPATQNRKEVQKDFWIAQNHERQHFRIKSQQSELIIHERNRKLEAVEKLHHLECWLQEFENSSPTILQKTAQEPESTKQQQVRYLTAEDGIYFYPSHHFIAQTVHLQFFRLPGHVLPETIDPSIAFFIGTATEASFSACGKSPTFTAEHLHASFDPARGLEQ